MATMRDVIRAYRPELEMEDPVEADEVVEALVEKTDLAPEQVTQFFQALGDLAFWNLARAKPVTLPNVGSLYPTIDIKGALRAGLDIAPELAEKMNEPGEYRGGINRRENIGVPLERLAQMWNSANPDDPITDLDAYALPASQG